MYRLNTCFYCLCYGHFLFFLLFSHSFYFPLWRKSMSAVLSHTHSLLSRFPSDKGLCFHCACGIMDIFLPPLSHFHLPFFFFSVLILKEIFSKKMYRSFQEHYGKKMEKRSKNRRGKSSRAQCALGLYNGEWIMALNDPRALTIGLLSEREHEKVVLFSGKIGYFYVQME